MASAIGDLLEESRQKSTGDSLFWRRLPPIFELRVPARVTNGSGSSFLFPLPMPPKSIAVEYPFALEVTPTQGGLVVEQSGILWVDISLSGTMGAGVKPHKANYFGLIEPPERRFSRGEVLKRTMASGGGYSGQRILQHLRDAVFGLYADLKADPELAEDTQLILHLPKDGLHYVVEPKHFRMPRDVGRNRTSFDYDIQLTGVGFADELPAATEDKGILAKILSAIATIRKAIRLARAVIQDINRIRGEIEQAVRQIAGIFDDIASVFAEASEFVEGTKDAITTGRARFEDSITQMEAIFETFGGRVSDEVAHKANELGDAACGLLIHPDAFTQPPQAIVDAAFRRGMGLLAARSQSSLLAASTADAPGSLVELETTDLLPGDLIRDAAAREIPEELKVYRSSFRVEIRGETIEQLAGKYLGDGRLWRHIAILNGLEAPYISDAGLPNTLRPGDHILLPSTELAARKGPNAAVLGARPEDPQEVQELGIDFLAVEDPVSGLVDWVIDEDGGATDLLLAVGRHCVAQDLRTRVTVERGSDPLYSKLGLEKVIGLGPADLTNDALRFRISQAAQSDPRVVRADDVEILNPTPDTIGANVRVVVRASRAPVSVQVSTVPPAAA